MSISLSYQVKNYMTKEVNTIDHEATVFEAAQVMAADPEFEGYVVILEKGKPKGILTERDIVNKVIAQKLERAR